LYYHVRKSNMSNFGNKLRRARESKKLSLEDISNVTKIGSRMLKAIEEENFDQLPGGVFNKGFIRAYAKQLGLDPEDAISEYLSCLRQAQVDSQAGWDSERRTGTDRRKAAASSTPASKSASTMQSSVEIEEELAGLHLPRAEDIRGKPKQYLDRPSSGIPWLTIAVVLVIVLAAALFWVRHWRHTRPTKLVAPVETSAETTPAGRPDTVPQSAPPQTNSPAPTGAAPSRSSTAKLQNGAQISTNARNSAPDPTAPLPSSSSQPTGEKQPLPSSIEKNAGSLNLVIRASENSWISVSSDGQIVTQETLIAPAHTTVRADREIVVRVGNAAGITFTWKGQEIPAQGTEAEVKTLVFDSEGFHSPGQ